MQQRRAFTFIISTQHHLAMTPSSLKVPSTSVRQYFKKLAVQNDALLRRNATELKKARQHLTVYRRRTDQPKNAI